MAKDVIEACARKTLAPWLVATCILIGATFTLAFFYADDIRQARSRLNQPPLAGPRQPNRSRTAAGSASARPAAFVPPWHGQQNPDAVTGATPQPMSFNQAIAVVSPAVVGINTSGAGEQIASGIITHRRGYILTNYHVVHGAKNIVVTLSYDQLIKAYPAKLVDSRGDLDLAIIKVDPAAKEVFTPAPLGNSDRIYIGQQVVAIGNPFGLSQSASAGIISNADRTLTAGDSVFNNLIQTDASMNPGSSGGALVSTSAQVIGINTAIYSPTASFSGIGFAVPINQAKRAFPDFVEIVQSPLIKANARAAGGNTKAMVVPPPGAANLRMMAARTVVKKCWLGVATCPVDEVIVSQFNLPIRYGVLVNRVFGNSPASKAGLARADVIFRVDNKRVRDDKMLWSFLGGKQAGDSVRIGVLRNNNKEIFVARLEPEPPNIHSLLLEVPQGPAAGAAGADGIEEISWLGIDIQPIEAGEAMQEFGISLNQSGVFIGEVEGIAAIEAGLAAGDVIKKVNNKRIKDINSFKDVIKKVDVSEGVLLDIVRQKRPFYITIRPTKQDLGAWQ